MADNVDEDGTAPDKRALDHPHFGMLDMVEQSERIFLIEIDPDMFESHKDTQRYFACIKDYFKAHGWKVQAIRIGHRVFRKLEKLAARGPYPMISGFNTILGTELDTYDNEDYAKFCVLNSWSAEEKSPGGLPHV